MGGMVLWRGIEKLLQVAVKPHPTVSRPGHTPESRMKHHRR